MLQTFRVLGREGQHCVFLACVPSVLVYSVDSGPHGSSYLNAPYVITLLGKKNYMLPISDHACFHFPICHAPWCSAICLSTVTKLNASVLQGHEKTNQNCFPHEWKKNKLTLVLVLGHKGSSVWSLCFTPLCYYKNSRRNVPWLNSWHRIWFSFRGIWLTLHSGW